MLTPPPTVAQFAALDKDNLSQLVSMRRLDDILDVTSVKTRYWLGIQGRRLELAAGD
jgi:hypothetical protein